MDPLVTIAITSYNYGEFLGDAIRSALSQTYRNIEVLVLDNASTDDSVAVARSFQDERLRIVVHPENIGLQANHNAGMRLARGEYVVLLAADDMLLPTLIEDVFEYRRSHPHVDIVYASVAIADRAGRILYYFDHPAHDGADYYEGRNELGALLTRDNCIYLPTTIFPKSIFDELGYFDETMVLCDYEFDLRLAGAGKRFGFFSKPEAVIRFHGDNASGVKNLVSTGRQLREFSTILERYTQPSYHEALAGYGHELGAMMARKVAEIAQPFPSEYAAIKAELDPLVQAATASIGTVPLVGEAVRRGKGLISTVIPYTGRAGGLQRALESLAAQRYENWEAIVVSDCAPDPSGLIAKMGLGDLVRVSRTRREAFGPSGARNLGLAGTRGEIVTYLDEDNRFEDGYFEALGAAFADPTISATAGGVRLAVVADNGDVVGAIDTSLGRQPGMPVSWVSNALPLNAVAHRRSVISSTGVFHRGLTLLEDWEFLIRLNKTFPVERIGAPACVVCVNLSLRGHHVLGRQTSAQWSEYASRLQDIYTGHLARSEAERDARLAFVAGLQPVIQRGVNAAGNANEVTTFALALAGVPQVPVA